MRYNMFDERWKGQDIWKKNEEKKLIDSRVGLTSVLAVEMAKCCEQ